MGVEFDGSKPGPGRPKGSRNKFTQTFEELLRKVEKQQGKAFIQHCIERAFVDDKMAAAILKKIIPDLRNVEITGTLEVDGKVKITHQLELNSVLLQGLPKQPKQIT